ncbi:DUF7344 domain-containing protein [Halorubrum sp. DTA46]|uniref:DUF7344 domain-containing protein n=1 Tax=Halorubrum sp. DTA46 TaxID=3402162 RepID=UPI003AAF205C
MDEEPEQDTETDTGSESPSSEGQEIPVEVLELAHVYEALSHPRRRYLCYSLLEDTRRSLRELARNIAAWENEIPEDAVTDSQQQRVYVSLYHVHVPKLADDGVVWFDAASETVTAARNAEQVLAALEGIGGSLDSPREAHARSDQDDDE